jgi:hypothetical protein
MSNQLIIAERGLPAEEVLKFLDKNLLKALCEEEKLFPEGGCEDLENPDGVTIRFQNFCGFLDRENTTLVVSKKLLHLLGLEGKDFDEQRRIFNEKFERFLWRVLSGLAELGILYSLSAVGYPVEEKEGNSRSFSRAKGLHICREIEEYFLSARASGKYPLGVLRKGRTLRG